jgi:chromosome partitioning protein
VKVEHVDYAGDDYVLRFLAYPATYTVSETSTSGYGAVIDARFVSETKDFEVGGKYQLVSDSSCLVVYPEIPKGDTTYHDTIYYHIASGELRVDTAEGYRTFRFGLLTSDGDSITGSYLGEYQYNYVLDQIGYGELAFDTVIQRNIRLGEAPSHGKPIMLYDAAATGAVNYLTLAKEFLKRNRKANK